jgi:hypothetical protein
MKKTRLAKTGQPEGRVERILKKRQIPFTGDPRSLHHPRAPAHSTAPAAADAASRAQGPVPVVRDWLRA